MTTQDKVFLIWFKKTWIGNEHCIHPDMIHQAASMLGDPTLIPNNSINYQIAVRTINEKGLELMQKENAEKRDGDYFRPEPQTVEVKNKTKKDANIDAEGSQESK